MGKPTVTVFKEFVLYCAHRVAAFGVNHKCNRIHGHSYQVRVEVDREVGDDWVSIAFDGIEHAWNRTCKPLDHTLLNDDPDIGEHATVERLAFVIKQRMDRALEANCFVTVRETQSAGVTIR